MHAKTKVKPQANHGLEFPFEHPPLPANLCEVASGVHWLRMPLPFALDHINLWLLEDDGGWTIVDCGFGSDETRAAWEKIFSIRLNGKPVTRIVVTHFHPDHFGLAAWLSARWNVPVHMTGREFAAAEAWFEGGPLHRREGHAAMFALHGLVLSEQSTQRQNLFKRGVPALPSTILPLDEGMRLQINGREWRVMTAHGHSPDHAVLYCDDLRVLIAGDMVLPRISTNVSVQPSAPDADPLGSFIDALNRFKKLDPATLVLPSHGLPFYGLHERIAALNEHHVARLDELISACATPQTGAQLLPVLFNRPLDAQQTVFAMGETLSHINYLHRRGELSRQRDANGPYRYARVSGDKA